jgi:predicted Zn-dependent protease
VTIGTASAVPKKKRDTVPVSTEPVLIESPGYVGLLVVPESKAATDIKVTLKAAEQWESKTSDRKLNQKLNQLVSRVNEVQVLISSNKAKEALHKLEGLQASYPEITYLNFLKASCYVLLGETSRAKVALETAMRDFPENEDGKALYQTISGGGRR